MNKKIVVYGLPRLLRSLAMTKGGLPRLLRSLAMTKEAKDDDFFFFSVFVFVISGCGLLRRFTPSNDEEQ